MVSKNSDSSPVFIHETATVDKNARIGAGTKIWHYSHVSPRAQIGSNCSFGQNVYVADDVCIGDGCKIQNNVSLYDGIRLGNDVFCGPSCVFTNDPYPRAHSSDDWIRLVTYVYEGASIGANATIVCGNTIGRHAMVAAGAVVIHDVADHSLVAGVPAKQIGWVCICGRKLEEAPSNGQLEKTYLCPDCKAEFSFKNK